MASSKIYKHGYLAAGSLVETVIAITLITLCLLIALQLHITVMDRSAEIDNGEIQASLNNLVSEMKLKKNYEPETYNFATYSIRKTVAGYENRTNLLKVRFTVRKSKDTINHDYLVLQYEKE